MEDDRDRLLGTNLLLRTARWGVIAWASIGVLALAYILFRFVILPIRILFPPLVVALVLVYVLNPVVSWLQNRGIPRLLATFLTYLVLLGAMGIGLRYLIPVLVDQVAGFSRSFPNLLDRAQESIRDFMAGLGIEGGGGGRAFESEQVAGIAEQLFSITLGILNGALVLILGLIFSFYLLVDLPKIQRGMIGLIPTRRRPGVLSVLQKLGRAVGGFFRGQLLVALFVGLASTLALFIVGLPYWAVVGMVSGLFNLIPLIGPFIGGGIAAFVAFTTDTATAGLVSLQPGWPLALGAAIALTIVQQIDNHIISPNVVARTVKLHPVTVMLALLAGGTLLGLWGMLLAVPTVASIKILILHAWDTQMTWPPAPPGGGPAPTAPAAPEPATVPTESGKPVEAAPGGEPAEAATSAGPVPAEAGTWRRLRRWRSRRRGVRRQVDRRRRPEPVEPP